MYNPHDPRFRRTLNQISHNLESANESAQVGLFSFKEHYLKPCLESFQPCWESLQPCFAAIVDNTKPCLEPCLPMRQQDERPFRRLGGRYSRMESSFDFYDDWDADDIDESAETDALLAAGNNDYDQHQLGQGYGATGIGSTSHGTALEGGGGARRSRILGYGARSETKPFFGQKKITKRRSSGVAPARRSSLDPAQDPTVIPNQSFLGFDFLSRLPFKFTGGGGLKYKPSAAGLQDRSGGRRKQKNALDATDSAENGDLHNAGRRDRWSGLGRERNGTVQSNHTSSDSLSSRGDIFPSDEDEVEDAVALTDEFDMVLDKTYSHANEEEETSLKIGGSGNAQGRRSSSVSNANTGDGFEEEVGEVEALSARRSASSKRLSGRSTSRPSDASQNVSMSRLKSPDANPQVRRKNSEHSSSSGRNSSRSQGRGQDSSEAAVVAAPSGLGPARLADTQYDGEEEESTRNAPGAHNAPGAQAAAGTQDTISSIGEGATTAPTSQLSREQVLDPTAEES